MTPTRAPLAALLDARTMAIVGASPTATRVGGIPVKTMQELGTSDRVLLINPKYAVIGDQACYPDFDALPWTPDLAVLAIGAGEVLPSLRAAHERGVGAAVVFAAGFAEGGSDAGGALQAELEAFAAESGMQIAGPNCMGFANLHTGLFANFIGHTHQAGKPGPTAIISQSGNIIFAFARAAGAAGAGFSYIVSTGNEACVDLAGYLEHFAADPHTGAVVGYVEQVRDGPRFLQVAYALRRKRKPLFLLKAGRSAKGAEASVSHTAAIAGDAGIYDAVFRQLNIMTANEPQRVMDLVRLWQTSRRPRDNRIGVFSLSGAGCVLLADMFSEAGGVLPSLSSATQTALQRLIPSYGMVANPVDLTGYIANDPTFFPRALDVILGSGEVEVLIVFVTGYLLEQFAEVLMEKSSQTGTLIVAVDTALSPVHEVLERGGIPVFTDLNRAVAAVTGYVRWASAEEETGWRPPQHRSVTPGLVSDGAARSLTEVEAKAMLSDAGIAVVREIVATDKASAVAAARDLGYPVAVKILSPDILHKTEVGGVELNLHDADSVSEAFDLVTTSARAAAPAAVIEGVVVQALIPDGVPMLLGVTRDPVFGPYMTVGLGGVLTEMYQDVSQRLLPVDETLARQMLDELLARPLLDGYRGAPPADVDALVWMMCRLSDFYLESEGALDEVEINPVLVRPSGQGAIGVDGLITLRG